MRVSARDKGAIARMAPYTSRLKAPQACALVGIVTLLALPLVHGGQNANQFLAVVVALERTIGAPLPK